jgi:uncharacterized protein
MENRLENLRKKIDTLISKENFDNTRVYISHMYGVARFCTLLAMKRKLIIELATTCGMLHDIHYMSGGIGDSHAIKGSKQAEAILRSMNAYSEDEISIITNSILRHTDKNAIHDPYDELLKDADVMDHCFYNADFPIADREVIRYRNLLKELNLN